MCLEKSTLSIPTQYAKNEHTHTQKAAALKKKMEQKKKAPRTKDNGINKKSLFVIH